MVALACVSSLLSAATSPSAAGLIPEVLPGELVQAGNALHGVGRNLTLVIGAGLGGFLVARFGIGVAMSVDLGHLRGGGTAVLDVCDRHRSVRA